MPFWRCFHTFSISFSRPIFLMICLTFSSFFRFSLFGRTLGDTHSTRWNIWFPYIHLFRKIRFSINTLFEKYIITALFFASSFHQFSRLFRHRFSHRCLLRLFMKMAPKMNDPVVPGPPKKRYFSKPSLLYRSYVDVGSLWLLFWITLAPFWLTVGALWLSFGVLGLTFWCPWAHFWWPWRLIF